MLVDTHCHLGDERFAPDRADVVERARSAGVGHVLIVADSLPATEQAIELALTFGMSATAGVHPHAASSWNAEVAAQIEQRLGSPTVVAVGETGLDYHYDHSPRDVQRRAFEAQLELGARHGLPVVVHARAADDDMATMLRDTAATVVMHSFSSGLPVFEAAMSIGAYFSFSGMVTFKNWNLSDRLTACPPDRLLVETDAPYLAPVPHRGHRNEPAYVVHVASRVAEVRGLTTEELALHTTLNAGRCFGSRVAELDVQRT